jgi:hypothetical protein
MFLSLTIICDKIEGHYSPSTGPLYGPFPPSMKIWNIKNLNGKDPHAAHQRSRDAGSEKRTWCKTLLP